MSRMTGHAWRSSSHWPERWPCSAAGVGGCPPSFSEGRILTSSSTRGRRALAPANRSSCSPGDHEYRGEETLPALARILARRYGFTCSVFFTTDPKTGFIEPGSSNIAGLEALKTADLLIVFLRFQDFPDDEMQHIVDYLDRGGPVIGLRTATHAFQIQSADAKFVKYTWNRGSRLSGRLWPADSR